MFQVAKSAISHGEEFKELHVLFIQGKKIRTRGCREIANGLDGQRHRQHKSERVWKSILSSSVLPNGCCRNGDWAGARRREAV